ncbi:hypothetical protein AVEN_146249-1 [Araneus ventricosus]|uniref:Uncharacterized protein n=1 Tax=Araneus ventricosus TaxID=182803 RepID=A0A4Y2KAP1_ARAVE|nr:hypothetical protein AVEN_146249-1 [Araneus ventricosus]
MARGLVSASVASRVKHQRKGKWSDGVSASIHKCTAKPCAVGTARLFGIPPTTVHKCEPRATRGLLSQTPSKQGLKRFHSRRAN